MNIIRRRRLPLHKREVIACVRQDLTSDVSKIQMNDDKP